METRLGSEWYRALWWHVPARWGNKLNGNSFGSSIPPNFIGVPTRWGNKLNGNTIYVCSLQSCSYVVPTRWGNKLNGNEPPTQSQAVELD